jgi:hypothetical protein
MEHLDSEGEQIAAVVLLIVIVVMLGFVAQDTEKIAYEQAIESVCMEARKSE